MRNHPPLADTLRLRVDVTKITNGELLAVRCEDGLGEWMVFEEREHDIASPIAEGRYYAVAEEGTRGHVVELEADEDSGYRCISVSANTDYFGESVSREYLESNLGDTIHLLERVDQPAK